MKSKYIKASLKKFDEKYLPWCSGGGSTYTKGKNNQSEYIFPSGSFALDVKQFLSDELEAMEKRVKCKCIYRGNRLIGLCLRCVKREIKAFQRGKKFAEKREDDK